MELKAQINTDLKNAMRASDGVRKRTLRMVIANIKMAEIDRGTKLDDTAIMALLQKEIKSRREAIAEAEKANRPDLAQASQDEIGVLEAYLPKAMDDAELNAAAQAVIQEMSASTITDMGKVMKALLPRLQGRAAGDRVSRVVRELLQK